MVIDVRNYTNRMSAPILHTLLMLGFTLMISCEVYPQSTVGLGAASGFAALASAGITNNGNAVLSGDIGSYPSVNITGFPPGKFSGVNRMGDNTVKAAMADFTAAYNDAASRTTTAGLPEELGGRTLTAGVYNSESGKFEISGTLILDARNNDSAIFIFQTASTLSMSPGSRVVLINGAVCSNIFWQVGSSAILGTHAVLQGSILAHSSITLKHEASVNGHLFAGAVAISGAITLDDGMSTPAELAVFTAILYYKTIVLKWATATEVDNYGFVIQRNQPSKNGTCDNNWTKIGFVKGVGASNLPKNYIYTDKSAPRGNYAYRLKQLDNSGHFTYSDVVVVSTDQVPEELQTDLY